MNTIDCNVIYDLLPLYIDNACSKESAELVEAHLPTCKKCQKLWGEMNTGFSKPIQSPDFKSQRVFRNIRRHLLGIILAIAFMISCFIINAPGAWEGGPAQIGHLITTIVYLIFWSIFSILSRKYKPLLNVSFVISLLTVISSANGLMWRLLDQGGFISAFISIFTSIPFYGLRMFLDWTGLYFVATVLSLCWLIYTGVYLRRLEKSLTA